MVAVFTDHRPLAVTRNVVETGKLEIAPPIYNTFDFETVSYNRKTGCFEIESVSKQPVFQTRDSTLKFIRLNRVPILVETSPRRSFPLDPDVGADPLP